MSKKYYANSSIWIEYTIRELYTFIKVSKLYKFTNLSETYIEWEHLDISFKVEYNTTQYYEFTMRDTPVYWATVIYYIVPLNGNPLNPSDVIKFGKIPMNATGIFEIRNIPLSNNSGPFSPGDYQIYIKANATDCMTRWFTFNLTILKKLSTTLTITRYPPEFKTDQSISITAKLDSTELQEKWHFNGKVVYFNITVYYNSYDPTNFQLQAQSDPYGKVNLLFNLGDYVEHLDDISRVEINSYFLGYEGYYPTKSFTGSSSNYVKLEISVPFNFMFIIWIALGVFVATMAVIVIHRKVIVPKGIQKTKSINYLFTSFRDVVGLQNLFVLLKSSGTCILTKTYSPVGIADSMQNVLLNVIANYGKGDQRHDAFCDLVRFEDFMLLLDDGDFVRVAVTVETKPSDKLIRSLVRFVQFFELQNYSVLKEATGPVTALQGVDELLDLQFGASLIAPYTISKIKKISGFEETLMVMATSLMEDHGYFYLSQLYARAKSETLVDEMMIFKTIQDLMDKKIIVPYTPTNKRKDFAKKFAKTEFDRIKVDLISAKNKALKALNASQFEDAEIYYREAASLAAKLGDFEAKDQFLKKAQECAIKVKQKELEKEKISAQETSLPISKPSIEPIPEDAPKDEEIKPIPEKITPTPSSLEEVRQRSIDLLELDESSPEPEELTPFEKALAIKEQEVMKAADLIKEEPEAPSAVEEEIPPIVEEALRIVEEVPKKPEPASEEILPPSPKTEELVEAQVSSEEIPASTEPTSIEELPPETLPIEEIIEPSLPSHPTEPAPPLLSDKELNILIKLLKESRKNITQISDDLTQLTQIYHDLSKQKEQTTETIKKTSQFVLDKTKELLQHLLIPRKNLTEELEITKVELPKLISDIDTVDSEAIKLKKNLTTSQKECKNL
ncbi:MAG: hypothetical protein ACTSYB_12060, partial [Candidatus Helarchaeota archaeon]